MYNKQDSIKITNVRQGADETLQQQGGVVVVEQIYISGWLMRRRCACWTGGRLNKWRETSALTEGKIPSKKHFKTLLFTHPLRVCYLKIWEVLFPPFAMLPHIKKNILFTTRFEQLSCSGFCSAAKMQKSETSEPERGSVQDLCKSLWCCVMFILAAY